jgi:hypothetical protein
MKRKPARDLPTIGHELSRQLKLGSQNIVEIGKLLTEASKLAKHGEWLPWLQEHFGKSENTARNYMWAASLTTKYANFAHLKINPSAVFALKRHNDDVIAAVMKAAKTRWISVEDIASIARSLSAQPTVDAESREARWEAMTEAFAEARAAEEADALLDGPPPELPDTPPSPAAGRETFTRDDFRKAVEIMKTVITKPAVNFVETCDVSDLEKIVDFLQLIITEQSKEKAA